jgi:transmembrane sensor
MSVDESLFLLRRYAQGHCTPDEIRRIDQWYDQLGADIEPLLAPDEKQALQYYLWQRIERRINAATTQSTPSANPASPFTVNQPAIGRQWIGWAAAAVVLVGIGSLVVYRSQPSTMENPVVLHPAPASATDWRNDGQRVKTISLADGSVVQLQPDAHLRSMTGKTQREVWLTGRAFFQVKKDSHRPFLVYAGAVVTRVLGTSFWVDASAGQTAVNVSVRTGRVWVSRLADAQAKLSRAGSSATGVVLTPNERVRFDAEADRFITGLVDRPEPIEPIQENSSPEPGSFVFDDQPVTDVLAQLQSQYGITIVLEQETLTHCRFTGNISQQPLYTQLELICRAIDARYEIIGTRIVVSGSGCPTL